MGTPGVKGLLNRQNNRPSFNLPIAQRLIGILDLVECEVLDARTNPTAPRKRDHLDEVGVANARAAHADQDLTGSGRRLLDIHEVAALCPACESVCFHLFHLQFRVDVLGVDAEQCVLRSVSFPILHPKIPSAQSMRFFVDAYLSSRASGTHLSGQ